MKWGVITTDYAMLCGYSCFVPNYERVIWAMGFRIAALAELGLDFA
jgi:hypothetical protein